MASQAPSWAAVGAAKEAANHARVAGEKRLSALIVSPLWSCLPTVAGGPGRRTVEA
jgi:hypothetical protein